MSRRVLLVFVPVAIALTSTGCATKKFVRASVQPLETRLGQLEQKTTKTDTSVSELERGLAGTNERVQAADARAGEAKDLAGKASDRAGQAGDRAEAVNTVAVNAKSTADRGLAENEGLRKQLASIENFKLVGEDAVHFQSGKWALDDESKQKLDATAAKLGNLKRYVIEIQGFADKTGPADLNYELSRKRAADVVRYLNLQHKVPLYRIHTLGLGEDKPVADDKTREGRQQNRRVEIRVFSADDALGGGKLSASTTGGGL